MTSFDTKLPFIYLKPGEIHISSEPSMVTTVLGSCVSVTMFSRRHGTGAICHIMLPKCRCKNNCDNDCMKCIYDSHGGCRRDCADALRYADCSIGKMLTEFKTRGIRPEDIETKMFGGSDMIALTKGTNSTINVGKQNIDAALQGIEEEGLKLTTYDVGGSYGRKIIFHTHTGEVFLKRIEKSGL